MKKPTTDKKPEIRSKENSSYDAAWVKLRQQIEADKARGRCGTDRELEAWKRGKTGGKA